MSKEGETNIGWLFIFIPTKVWICIFFRPALLPNSLILFLLLYRADINLKWVNDMNIFSLVVTTSLFTKPSPFVKKSRMRRACVVPPCCFVVVWNSVWILQKETFSAPLSFSHCFYVYEFMCAYMRVCIMWMMLSSMRLLTSIRRSSSVLSVSEPL